MSSKIITIGKLTDKGLSPKRPYNEDSLLVLPDRGLYLVADGVGGRRGGEVASSTVVEVFNKIFNQQHHEDLRNVVEGAIDLANQKIFSEAELNPELAGMATTLALVAVEGKRAIVAHVGDSRVYRHDGQGLICLTEDHSEVNEALRAGIITEEQAANHPRKNVINRAIGAEPDVEPDVVEIDIDDRTSFILCTDGITRHITDEEIERLMKSGLRPDRICEKMKELCYAGGAEDNLTVIVADFGKRNYIVEDHEKPAAVIPAKAASGHSGGIPLPRPTRKFEVSIAATAQPEKPADASTPAPKNSADDRFTQVTQLTGADSKSDFASAPEKVELSSFMKWSLLILTTIAGLMIGTFLGRPVIEKFGSLFGARDIFNRAGVEKPPADPEVNAAYARYLEGQTIESRERLVKVLSDNPNNAEANFYLGRIDYAQGRYDEAISHLSQALKLDPNLHDIRIHLAMAYLSVGQQRNARDVLQQVVAPGSTPAPLPSPTVTSAPAASPASGAAKATKPVG